MIFIFILILEFFISGAAAKAFLVMPIIIPLADMIGLSRQCAVLAFCFGDGYTNMLFPTSAVLLIALGIVNIPYSKWLQWTWKIALALFAVSCAFLCLSVAVGYGPF